MNERILARQDEEKMGKLYTYRREEASAVQWKSDGIEGEEWCKMDCLGDTKS
jgi:hypothetical protein